MDRDLFSYEKYMEAEMEANRIYRLENPTKKSKLVKICFLLNK